MAVCIDCTKPTGKRSVALRCTPCNRVHRKAYNREIGVERRLRRALGPSFEWLRRPLVQA